MKITRFLIAKKERQVTLFIFWNLHLADSASRPKPNRASESGLPRKGMDKNPYSQIFI